MTPKRQAESLRGTLRNASATYAMMARAATPSARNARDFRLCPTVGPMVVNCTSCVPGRAVCSREASAKCSSLVSERVRTRSVPSWVGVMRGSSAAPVPVSAAATACAKSARVFPSGSLSSMSVPPVNSMLSRGPGVKSRTALAATRSRDTGKRILAALRKENAIGAGSLPGLAGRDNGGIPGLDGNHPGAACPGERP